MAWHTIAAKLLSKIAPQLKVDVKNPVIIKTLNIHITNNSFDQDISYDPTKGISKINLDKLTQNIKQALISPEILDDERVLLEDNCKSTIEEFRIQEGLDNTQEILRFLDKKVPLGDLNIWRAALYLRYCSNTPGLKNRVGRIKYQLMQKYGDKGRNIANVCTANYIEEYLIPSYNSLSGALKDGDRTKQEFDKIYGNFVNELPFTIFVSHLMTREQLKAEILRKKGFGISFINIHAINDENVQKVKDVVLEIEKERERCDEVKKHHIFVRIYFKKDT